MFGRDERRCHTYSDLFAALRVETYHCHDVVALGLVAYKSITVLLYAIELKRFVELQDEIVAEVLRYTTAIAGRVASDGTLIHVVFDGRALVEGIDHDA